MARFIIPIPVWGERFVDLHLNVCLASMLSPANLPALRQRNECLFLFQTREADVERIRAHPSYHRLKELMPVRFSLIPDQDFTDPHATISNASRRAVRLALAAGMDLMFIPPDEVLSDGTIRRIDELADAGYKVVYVLTPRLLKDSFVPAFHERFPADANGAISARARDLTALAMEHLHPVSESLFLDSDQYTTGPSQLYWRVGRHAMLARGFHLHPIMVRPVHGADTFADTIDGELVAKVVTTYDEIYVAHDSDDMLMFEMSDMSRTSGMEGPNRADFKTIQNWVRNLANDVHRHLASYPIRFHDGVEQYDWKPVEIEAETLVGELLRDPEVLKPISEIFFNKRVFLRELPFIQGEVLREDYEDRLRKIRPLRWHDVAFLKLVQLILPNLPHLRRLRQALKLPSFSSIGSQPLFPLGTASIDPPTALAWAERFMRNDQPAAAIGILTRAIVLQPTIVQLYAARAEAFAAVGRIAEANENRGRAGLPPITDVSAVARTLMAKGDFDAACKALDFAIAQNGHLVGPYQLRSEVNVKLGRLDEADADRARAGLPPLSDRIGIARELLQQGKLHAAAAAAKVAATNALDDIGRREALELRMKAEDRLGRQPKSPDEATNPADLPSVDLTGTVELCMGDEGSGEEIDLFRIAANLVVNGRTVEAIAILERLVATAPDVRDFVRLYSLALAREGHIDEANRTRARAGLVLFREANNLRGVAPPERRRPTQVTAVTPSPAEFRPAASDKASTAARLQKAIRLLVLDSSASALNALDTVRFGEASWLFRLRAIAWLRLGRIEEAEGEWRRAGYLRLPWESTAAKAHERAQAEGGSAIDRKLSLSGSLLPSVPVIEAWERGDVHIWQSGWLANAHEQRLLVERLRELEGRVLLIGRAYDPLFAEIVRAVPQKEMVTNAILGSGVVGTDCLTLDEHGGWSVEDESYDAAIFVRCLSKYCDFGPLMQELGRILRREGTLIVHSQWLHGNDGARGGTLRLRHDELARLIGPGFAIEGCAYAGGVASFLLVTMLEAARREITKRARWLTWLVQPLGWGAAILVNAVGYWLDRGSSRPRASQGYVLTARRLPTTQKSLTT